MDPYPKESNRYDDMREAEPVPETQPYGQTPKWARDRVLSSSGRITRLLGY